MCETFLLIVVKKVLTNKSLHMALKIIELLPVLDEVAEPKTGVELIKGYHANRIVFQMVKFA